MVIFWPSPIIPPWKAKSAESAVALSVAPGVEEGAVGAGAAAGSVGAAAEPVPPVAAAGSVVSDEGFRTVPPLAALLPPDFGGSGGRGPLRSIVIRLKMPRG